MTYRVTWEIDSDADSPEEAVREALQAQRTPNTTATFFKVQTLSRDFVRTGMPVEYDAMKLPPVKDIPCCATCGSTDVCGDANVHFNPVTGLWERGDMHDDFHCGACNSECKIEGDWE